jgi:hypothetical protein
MCVASCPIDLAPVANARQPFYCPPWQSRHAPSVIGVRMRRITSPRSPCVRKAWRSARSGSLGKPRDYSMATHRCDERGARRFARRSVGEGQRAPVGRDATCRPREVSRRACDPGKGRALLWGSAIGGALARRLRGAVLPAALQTRPSPPRGQLTPGLRAASVRQTLLRRALPVASAARSSDNPGSAPAAGARYRRRDWAPSR